MTNQFGKKGGQGHYYVSHITSVKSFVDKPEYVSSSGTAGHYPPQTNVTISGGPAVTQVCVIYGKNNAEMAVIFSDGNVQIAENANLTQVSIDFWASLGIPLSDEKTLQENYQLKEYIRVLKSALENKWSQTRE